MKLIRCILRHEDFPRILDELAGVMTGMTIWSAQYSSSPNGDRTMSYRGIKYKAASSRVAVEIVTDESWVDDIVRKLWEFEGSRDGDGGLVHILQVEAAYRIRSGLMEA